MWAHLQKPERFSIRPILRKKREIAQKAASFISEGECIILDSGSTTTEIAKLLTQYKELTVITNALNIALILGENPGINLIVTEENSKHPPFHWRERWQPIHSKVSMPTNYSLPQQEYPQT